MIGVLAGAIFGGLWGLAGASALTGARRAGATVAVTLAVALLIAFALALHPAGWRLRHPFRSDVYLVAVAAEAALIALAVGVLRRRRRSELIAPVVAVIVALHVIGLWLATGSAGFLLLSAGLMAPPLVAILVARSRPLPITGLGTCGILLLSAASGFIG